LGHGLDQYASIHGERLLLLERSGFGAVEPVPWKESPLSIGPDFLKAVRSINAKDTCDRCLARVEHVRGISCAGCLPANLADVFKGCGADFLQPLHVLPPSWRNRADVTPVVQGGASVCDGHRSPGVKRNDAAVACGPGVWTFRERPPALGSGEGNDSPLGHRW